MGWRKREKESVGRVRAEHPGCGCAVEMERDFDPGYERQEHFASDTMNEL